MMVRTFLDNILSDFHRGHASFFASSAIVQLFPLISAPIVARLYTPKDFGIYAVFYALAAILGGIAPLSLNNSAILEPAGEKSFQAAELALAVTLGFSVILLLSVLVVPDIWKAAVIGPDVQPFLIWLPFTVFLGGAFNCVYAWAVKADLFKLLARNKLILGVSTLVLQISIGLTSPGAIGFIVANFLGQLLALILLGQAFLAERRRTGWRLSRATARELLSWHKNLVIWTTSAGLVNYLSSFLPDLLINKLYGSATLGQFSLANRMVNFPLTFIATSVQDIFRQQAAQEFDRTGGCHQTFNRFLTVLVLVCPALIVPLVLVLPVVFPFVFGHQWEQGGYLIQATVVLIISRFISSPLSYVWILRGQLRMDFIWQLGLMASVLGTILLPPALGFKLGIYSALWVYGLGVGSWYIFCIYVSFRLSRNGPSISAPTQMKS